MQKALGSGADALILDLEDSVAPQSKGRARTDVASFLRSGSRSVPLFVRINSLPSGLADEDLAAVLQASPDGLVLPKAEGVESITELRRRISAGGGPALRILPIATETPAAIFRLGEYSAVAGCLAGITWGAEDLSAAVGAASAREPDGSYSAPFEMVRTMTLFAAHAAQVPAIETVYPSFRDLPGLTQYASRGARDGFSGMLAVHPLQVTIINAAFTPSAELVARARRVVAEFGKHPGAGVLSIDGAMVDAPHLKQAQRVLAQSGAADAVPGAPMNAPG
ncbi:MAG: CoA ester lyase [Gammaproteobacteria bacterium]|nr:CoA ester lyase [Gammaproteobacteria bacterium]